MTSTGGQDRRWRCPRCAEKTSAELDRVFAASAERPPQCTFAGLTAVSTVDCFYIHNYPRSVVWYGVYGAAVIGRYEVLGMQVVMYRTRYMPQYVPDWGSIPT